MELIAKTFQGLEAVLATELIELGANDIQIGNRMVSFTGDKAMMYRANFALHTALRILMPIKHFRADNADTVYEEVKAIEWERYMDIKTTFAVDANIFSTDFRHSQFVAYRVKDAIVDRWRDITDGEQRPNVRITNPDIRIDIHIAENDVTISLDSSGESLHRRGYRQEAVKAPLNEVMAAGIIKLTGWKGDCDFIDPMCGSGTLPIEAALIARNMAPGIFRQDYAFMHWRDFDEDLWQAIYDDDSNEREFDHHIYGYDINHSAVQIASDNVRAAGVTDIVTIAQGDIANFKQPAERAIMVTNPPYGERITTDDLMGLYETIGERLKNAFTGNDAYVLSSNKEAFDSIHLKPSVKFPLLNGNIEVELRKYQMFSGRYDDLRASGHHIKTAAEKAQNARGMRKSAAINDRPHSNREDKPRYNRDEKPRFNRDDKPRFNRDDKPRFNRDDKPRFNRDDKPRFNRDEKPRFNRDDKPRRKYDNDSRDSESWEAIRHRKMREMRDFLEKNNNEDND